MNADTVLYVAVYNTMMCFVVQLTDRPEFINRKYPIMVIIPGEDYINGDSMLYPAHILARKEVLVVTFNYRLGALGN